MLGFDKWVIGNAGTHIRVHSKSCACRYVQALITATLWSGDRCFEEYLGAAKRLPGTWFDTCTDSTQVDLLTNFDLHNIYTRACCLNDAKGGIHDFWSNAIPVSYCNGCICCHENSLPVYCCD